ncbi:galactonate dehydratase [Mesorhizobium sp. M1A.F.Ca.IN.022.07.1.1]|nr:galactonate dehydratase [Mesorhizobium sp. M1A.F.Ca.IN.022.06.1.1]OBQ87131.1 D-galactonate dehydratase [Mesorhizobium sp. WSM3873]OBQ97132.1 D-galactonate dehydratase [Mesorhizobium sp. AA23]PBB83146.1 galactonate dehydratase [Mesorhizobium sp. WSM3879]RUV15178.1 galactonate dehydratase [Mesorhizobium sp. M1A.F.Ca.IN.022.04.1.1]RUV70134.1 galactonate dehydratase [Mesorhizobium sp. M1A.F.Ca.IN.020.30.1.1]RUV83394.1 galactonate dehydratase [Mesorhizobium sp. M1A.F.Ca.IN.022.07.1.1]RUV99104.
MRIVAITTRVVNADMRNWVFVRVETDQPGLYGWGEATLEWKTQAVVGAVNDLAPLLVGRDPRDIEQAVRILKKHSFWRLGVIGMSAVSGIELALWDIFGKWLDQPVWRLLGGKVRDRVKVYTHLGLGDMRAVYETLETEPLVRRASEVVATGYRALKAVFIPYSHYHAPLVEVDKVGRLMEALRKTVGPEVEIMVDFHGRPASASTALAYIDALAPYRPMFVEEPLPPGETGALAQLVAKSRVPIATGERLIDRPEFDDLFRARAVDIVQPDICHCGGLLEAKKIAAMAEAVSVGVAPHNPLGPIAGAAALHFAVSTPNHLIQEEMVGAVPWYFEVVKGPIRMIDGCWQVPDAPGLGVEVDEAVADRHPYRPEVMHTTNAVLADGTIVDW